MVRQTVIRVNVTNLSGLKRDQTNSAMNLNPQTSTTTTGDQKSQTLLKALSINTLNYSAHASMTVLFLLKPLHKQGHPASCTFVVIGDRLIDILFG